MADELVLERALTVAPAVAFDAWITPTIMQRWMFASDTGEIVEVTADPRPGGTYSILERRADGEVDHFGTYTVVDRPRRLDFSLCVPAHFAENTTVGVRIAPTNAGCHLRFTQHGIDPDRTRGFWGAMLDALDRILTDLDS
jgi:uncharacterized protein YndB with AHSA1/START domain